MTPGPEQSGSGVRFWATDLFTFHLGEAALAGKTGSQQIVIDGGMAPNPNIIAADVIQLNGVHQGNPIATFAGGGMDGTNPKTLASTIAVTAGSSIVLLTGANFASPLPSPNISPSSQINVTDIMVSRLAASGSDFGFHGAYVDGPPGPDALAAGQYSVGWTWSFADHATHLALVINPAQQ
jgi:hypothetical protein